MVPTRCNNFAPAVQCVLLLLCTMSVCTLDEVTDASTNNDDVAQRSCTLHVKSRAYIVKVFVQQSPRCMYYSALAGVESVHSCYEQNRCKSTWQCSALYCVSVHSPPLLASAIAPLQMCCSDFTSCSAASESTGTALVKAQ
eukprot:9047-Heterococcus_DN1.PRE.3